jgi:hypothetical protein
MSTTIRVARWCGLALLVLLAWAAIMVAMPFVGPAGRQVAVVGETGAAIRAVAAAGGRLVEIRNGAVLAQSDDPHFPSRLYRSGARLVLEGRIGAGCFSRR